MTTLTTQPQQPPPAVPRRKGAIIWENIYPTVGGVAALAMALFVQWKLPALRLPSELGQLFSSTLDIGAIAIGFLATAKTVLLSIQGSIAVERMRGSGLYEGLLKFILKAIRSSFALAAFSLACIFLDKAISDIEVAWELVVSVWLALVITTGLASYRVIDVFFTILSPKDFSTLRPHEHSHQQKPLQIIVPPKKEPSQPPQGPGAS